MWSSFAIPSDIAWNVEGKDMEALITLKKVESGEMIGAEEQSTLHSGPF